MSIHIRDIAKMPVQEVIRKYNEREGSFDVEFDDGILAHSGSEIVYTRFILNYWNELPRDFQIVKRYSIAFERKLDPETPLELCSRILADYVDLYEYTEWDIDDKHMGRVVYRDVINALYNFHVEFLTPYVQGASSLDIIEIMKHPTIHEANTWIQGLKREPNADDIDKVHDVIKDAILNSPELKHNSFVIALRCKSIKMMQMQMVIGPIGFCTDIDSSLFPKAIRTGFYEGSAQLWEFAIESRNASIASLYNELIMPEAQYANRRYQLFAQPIRWVVRADCGTQRYKNTLITDKTKLKRMSGLWRLDEKTQQLVAIKGTEQYLIGTFVKHRSATKCEWDASRGEVCSRCHGQVYRALMEHPEDTLSNIKGRNAGHLSSIQTGAANSSVVLSRKHANATSVASKYELSFEQQAYMRVSDNGKFLMLHDQQRSLDEIVMRLPRMQVEKLYDVAAGLISAVAPATLTFVEDFTIIDMKLDEGYNTMPYMLGSKARAGHLSIDFVDYICEHGWEFDDNRDLIINLSKWDCEKPMFIIPQIELSPPEFIDQVTSFLLGPTDTSKKKDVAPKRLDSYRTVDEGIDAFYHEIADHLNVHYSHITLQVLALTAQDPDNDDYRLPFPRDTGKIVTEAPLLFNSSAGMQMAYEQQHKILSHPQSFVLHRRRGHPLDTLLLSRVYGNNTKVQPPLSSCNQ